jgi:hypothetical protein
VAVGAPDFRAPPGHHRSSAADALADIAVERLPDG